MNQTSAGCNGCNEDGEKNLGVVNYLIDKFK